VGNKTSTEAAESTKDVKLLSIFYLSFSISLSNFSI